MVTNTNKQSKNKIYFSSNEYLTRKLRQYLIKKFTVSKVCTFTKTNTPDFGHYSNATKLGWGFHNAHTYKIWLHSIYKNQSYYSPAMVVNYDYIVDNKDKIKDFLSNERAVIKSNKGYGGKNMYLVKTIDDCINILENSNNRFLLQKEIKPSLFNNRKFDLRKFYFVVRCDNKYYIFTTKLGWWKLAVKEYKKDGLDADNFITNISLNEIFEEAKVNKYVYSYNGFLEVYEKDKEKRAELDKSIQTFLGTSAIPLAKQIKKSNEEYYKEKKYKPYGQIMLFGPDIMLDENRKIYLIEANSSPGFLYDASNFLPEQHKLMDEVFNYIMIPILQRKHINLNTIKKNCKHIFFDRVI